MKNLFFWAQSLDNEAPDLIIRDDVAISDEKSREDLVSKVYKFSSKKIEPILSEAGVTVRYNSNSFKFVIEVIPSEKDHIERQAPIIIYGDFLDESPEQISKSYISNEIQNVVTKTIKRTLNQDTEQAIAKGLSLILEKKEKAQEKFTLGEQVPNDSIRHWLSRFINFFRYLLNKVRKK